MNLARAGHCVGSTSRAVGGAASVGTALRTSYRLLRPGALELCQLLQLLITELDRRIRSCKAAERSLFGRDNLQIPGAQLAEM